MRTVLPVSPGEMLEEELLKPLGLTKYRLAKDIGVPAQRIGEIVSGKRAVTADTAIRLGRYFRMTPQFWLNLQAMYDLEAEARQESRQAIYARIHAYDEGATQRAAEVEGVQEPDRGD